MKEIIALLFCIVCPILGLTAYNDLKWDGKGTWSGFVICFGFFAISLFIALFMIGVI